MCIIFCCFVIGMSLWIFNFFSGIRVCCFSEDWIYVIVELYVNVFMCNYVKIVFGGFMFVMIDFYFFMLVMY